MKIIIAGSREFNDYKYLSKYLNSIGLDTNDEIVVGGARGADALGQLFAYENGIPYKIFSALWSRYGRGAGFIRNKEMADYADALIAFWDGSSKGTQHMIETSIKNNLIVTVVNYSTDKVIEY